MKLSLILDRQRGQMKIGRELSRGACRRRERLDARRRERFPPGGQSSGYFPGDPPWAGESASNSPIADEKGTGVLDLELVEELVQLQQIDSWSESTGFWAHPEARQPPAGARAGSKTAPECLIDDFLERFSRAARLPPQFVGEIVIDRQRGAHVDIMMSRTSSIKMSTKISRLRSAWRSFRSAR